MAGAGRAGGRHPGTGGGTRPGTAQSGGDGDTRQQGRALLSGTALPSLPVAFQATVSARSGFVGGGSAG